MSGARKGRKLTDGVGLAGAGDTRRLVLIAEFKQSKEEELAERPERREAKSTVTEGERIGKKDPHPGKLIAEQSGGQFGVVREKIKTFGTIKIFEDGKWKTINVSLAPDAVFVAGSPNPDALKKVADYFAKHPLGLTVKTREVPVTAEELKMAEKLLADKLGVEPPSVVQAKRNAENKAAKAAEKAAAMQQGAPGKTEAPATSKAAEKSGVAATESAEVFSEFGKQVVDPPASKGAGKGKAVADAGANVAKPAATPPTVEAPPAVAAGTPEVPKASKAATPSPPIEAPRLPSGTTASHESLKPFSTRPDTTKGPRVGGPALDAGAQLLLDVQKGLEIEAVVRNTRLTQSLRTYRWWLQREIEPPAKAVYDRWFWDDETDVGSEPIGTRIRSGRLNGMIVGAIDNDAQYQQLEAWAARTSTPGTTSIATSSPARRPAFGGATNAGRRLRGNGATGGRPTCIKSWGRTSESRSSWRRFARRSSPEPNARSLGCRTPRMPSTRAAQPSSPENACSARASSAATSSVRRCRSGWRCAGGPPRCSTNRQYLDVPEEYTLVAGADFSTSVVIHEVRARRDTSTRPTGDSIGPLARYDNEHPYTGFGPVKVPCILVLKGSLTPAANP